jgi:hypothetical protein
MRPQDLADGSLAPTARKKLGGKGLKTEGKEPASCRMCTIRLVRLCYERARWFRWFREPLVLGMRLLARWHRVDPRDYAVRTEECYGCLRFLKEDLKAKSPLFARLNDLVNPTFNRLRDAIVTPEEIAEARRFAREAAGNGDDRGGPGGAPSCGPEGPPS